LTREDEGKRVPKQGETARRPAWPEDAVFGRLVLDVESDSCEHCGGTPCTSATIVSTASTPCRAPWSCPVAWLTAPTAFARFAAKPSAAELPAVRRIEPREDPRAGGFAATAATEGVLRKGEPFGSPGPFQGVPLGGLPMPEKPFFRRFDG